MQPEPEAPPENLVNVGQQETRGTLSNASTEKNIEIQYGILKGSVPVHVHCLQDKTDCTTELFTNKIIIRDITELSLKSFTFENRIFRITDSNIDESSIIKTLTPASDGSFETALPAGRIYMVLLDLGGIEYCHEPDCSPIIYENQATYHNITLIVNELPVYFDESPLEEVKACIKAEASYLFI
jgi:hypothetical protein